MRRNGLNLLRITYSKAKYGGGVYEQYIEEALQDFNITSICLQDYTQSNKRYAKILKGFFELLKLRGNRHYDIIIRPQNLCFFLSKKHFNIIIAHHVSWDNSRFSSKIIQILSYISLIFNKGKINALVVVSKFWEMYFRRRNFNNIYVIYNFFNIDDFKITNSEVLDFKNEHNLHGKTVVYIGNAQKKKGVNLVYNELKYSDYFLVSSGKKDIDLPIKNFDLSYRDYIKLLKVSSVVITFSQFNEGWCRTAHEAMMCKTPVIGSGRGGMYELLTGGGQIICYDIKRLAFLVKYALSNRERIGRQGFDFAKKFDFSTFSQEWKKVILDLQPEFSEKCNDETEISLQK